MSDTFDYDVFLSHSSKDRAAVRELADRLKRDGLRVWLDEWEIRPGDMIGLKIEQGVDRSRALVLVMSENAFASDWVTLERHTVLFRDPTNTQRRLIPLLLNDTEIKGVLKQFACIDWRERSAEQYARLLAACQATPGGLAGEREVPETRPFKSDPAFCEEQYFHELDRIYAESRIEDWYVALDGYAGIEGGIRQPEPGTLSIESRLEDRFAPFVGSMRFEGGNWREVCVDDYVDGWLESQETPHLAILGDYGTGKSWFCLRLAKRLADQYRLSPQSHPLPLLISFRHYQQKMDLPGLIESELFEGYGVRLNNPAVLRRMLRTGEIFPILDGMDEMAKEQGEYTALVAFARLGLAEEIPRGIITCRTHYFSSGSEEREILSPDAKSVLLENIRKFNILRLKPLDKMKINQCIQQRFEVQESHQVLHFIESTYNLPELSSRPVLLALICDSYEILKEQLQSPLTSVELYEAYTHTWLRRELREGRLTVNPERVKELFEDLAQTMVLKDTLVIGAPELRKMLAELLRGMGLSTGQWKEVERQLITSTFVKRSLSDGWEFAHRSFQEFFYARKFFRWELDTGGTGEFRVVHIPIWQFIAEMALTRWNESKALLWITPRIDRRHDSSLTLTTLRAAAAYWLLKKGSSAASEYPLSGIMLDSVDLQGLDLSGCDLSKSDLHRSNFARTNFSRANLSESLLIGANFEQSVLDQVDARGADCREASFLGASLNGADLRETFLRQASFVGAKLRGARFRGANIQFTNFRGADFGEPGSKAWQETLEQLGECSGYKTAFFK